MVSIMKTPDIGSIALIGSWSPPSPHDKRFRPAPFIMSFGLWIAVSIVITWGIGAPGRVAIEKGERG